MILSQKKILLPIICILVFGLFLFSFKDNNEPLNTISKNDCNYNVCALSIPENINFCGESVPLNDFDVMERFDRELLVNTYWQSNGFLFFKRAHKYFPIIEPILELYGVPNDFKYLALIESGLRNISSPAGAKGFWQFMSSTAKEYNLEVNSNVDERSNLILSTKAACNYLIKAKKRFGSWTLAAASYNAGGGRISNELKRQSVTSYYDLLLGEETSRYLFRILAVKEIFENPAKYGFNFTNSNLYSYPEVYSIEVDSEITDLVKFASKYKINYKQLKIHNPWLKETHLNNKSRKKYVIEIPKI